MKSNCKAFVFHGDCRVIVPLLGKFDLVFCDPPFNIGQNYNGYNDRRSDYHEFTLDWIEKCWRACNGILALHGPDNLADLYLQAARMFHMPRVAWVNWHYRFGQCNRDNWIDSRCHCLFFGNRPVTWNPESVLVPSDRKTTYNDPRINETVNGGERVPLTVWGIPSDGPNWGRIQEKNKERRKNHPNQLPELYLARIIKAYTNPGDRILDPFGGSGTTAVVASALNRTSVSVDESLANCLSIKERIAIGAKRCLFSNGKKNRRSN